MSFIRPELTETAMRWRECLAGAAAALVGAYLGQTGTGAAAIIGTGLVIAGALLMFTGFQRARFRQGKDGPGVVTLDEGTLTYFGPREGGVVAVSDLVAVDLLTGIDGSAWVLEAQGEAPLMIPVDAQGSEVLFDVFGGLDGLDTGAMLRAVESAQPGRVLIWAKPSDHTHIGAH